MQNRLRVVKPHTTSLPCRRHVMTFAEDSADSLFGRQIMTHSDGPPRQPGRLIARKHRKTRPAYFPKVLHSAGRPTESREPMFNAPIACLSSRSRSENARLG